MIDHEKLVTERVPGARVVCAEMTRNTARPKYRIEDKGAPERRKAMSGWCDTQDKAWEKAWTKLNVKGG
mgnify:CR=1 FL=1